MGLVLETPKKTNVIYIFLHYTAIYNSCKEVISILNVEILSDATSSYNKAI